MSGFHRDPRARIAGRALVVTVLAGSLLGDRRNMKEGHKGAWSAVFGVTAGKEARETKVGRRRLWWPVGNFRHYTRVSRAAGKGIGVFMRATFIVRPESLVKLKFRRGTPVLRRR